MVEKPTEEERLNFVRSYGVEPVDVNTDLTFKDAATTVAEMTPIIGDAMAAKEIYDELQKEDPDYRFIAVLGGAGLIGAIPGIGDVAAKGIRNAADMIKRIEVDPDALGSLGGNIRLKPKDQVDFDAKMAALDEAEDATTWQQNAKKVVKERGIDLDDKKSPEAIELQESTRLLLENKITRDQHLKTVDKVKPVSEYDQLPREPSDKALVFALDSGKREKGVFVLDDETASKLGAKTSSLKVGDQFNSRLDIPAYLSHDTWIVAGTSPAVKTADGKGVTSYAKAVHFGGDDKPVRFIASQKQSEKIGTGVDNKTGYATVSGTVKDLDADAIRAKAAELLNDPEWTQVGFDPRRQGGFYVRAGENKHVPVREATEVIQIGPLVLAKNAKLDLEYQGYSEGGMALEEQMAMNFGDVPDNTIGQDPVSGNDIPLGSTAENVRDDIPANLSEGEIVVAADVVNFHGVKLFEDLRREAKMGYAQMAEDGRIGGEPMDINDDMDIELSELDLEIMDDEAPVEMRRGGMSMKDYEGVTKNRDIKPPKRSGPRKTHAEIMASAFRDDDDNSSKPTAFAQSLSERVQARKDKPKNRFEAIRNRLRDIFDDDDEPKRQSRFDFGFSGNPMERAARKYGSPASATKNESLRAGQVAGAYRGGEEPENTSVRYYEQPFYKRLMEGIGFDEGGLVEDDEQQHLIGGESQFNEGPFYAQKGGFDMENAYANYGDGTGGPVLEMREYMNDDGHRIFITFIDGEPQMEIPAGYYPVGDSEVVAPTAPTPPVGGSGGSDMGDSGSGTDMSTPEPVNFKELSMEELTQLIEDQKSLGSKIVKNINPLVRIAMWDQTRRTKAEIERRLADPNTSNVDKMRLRQLLELANRDEPGLIKSLLDKVTGSTLETAAGQIPEPKVPDVDFDDPTEAGTVAEPYTPSEQEESSTTTPGVPSYDPLPPASSGFPAKPDPAEEFGGSQTRFQQPTVVPEEKRVSTPDPTPVNEMSPRVKAARQNTQKVLKDMRDRGASREDRTASMAAGARTEQVLRDLDRGVVRGFDKGGLVDKPKVKKVVKGLKKASKSHAKQAATLEDALKASKKKKSK